MPKSNKPTTVLGFDFGMKYIGIATGQTLTNTASPLTTIPARDGIPDWNKIEELIHEWQPQLLIVGLPYNMDGSTQELTYAAKKFANRLHHKYKVPIAHVNEELTTWEAKQNIKLTKKNPSKSDLNKINCAAAVIITEQWLHDSTKE